MQGALLCIGHELIQGGIVNENSRVTGMLLRAYGLPLGEIVVVPDDLSSIVRSLKRLSLEYDFLIVSGGLGPTEDDLTVLAVAQAFSLPLEEKEEVLKALENHAEYTKSWGLAKRLALLPVGSILLSRDLSMAGFRLDLNGKPFFFLPGVPSQFEILLKEVVIPTLLSLGFPTRTEDYLVLRFFDLNETDLNLFLQECLKENPQEVEIGYYPEGPEVKVVLKGEPKVLTYVQAKLLDRFSYQVVSTEGKSLPEVIGELLGQRRVRLAVAESCTGGLLASLITGVAGSSNYFEQGYVVYSEKSKVEVLGVSPETIAKYSLYSHETAFEMAASARIKAQVDYSLATTGLAGPSGGSEGLPVGTVFIALANREKVFSVRFKFTGERRWIQQLASFTALDMLRRFILYGQGLSCYRFTVNFKERTLYP